MNNHKWIRSDMDLYHINQKLTNVITILNTGDLDADFNTYAYNFYEAAECTMNYLSIDVANNQDIAKLDIWYFAIIYLYRQSLELLLKAIIFQSVDDNSIRKDIISKVRHDLKQAFEKIIEIKGLKIENNQNAIWVFKYFSNISQIDKESDMFRYPFGNNCKVLFEKQTHISLIATHDNMNKAYNIIREIYETGDISKKEYNAYSPKLIIEGGEYYQQSVVGYTYSKQAYYPYYSSYEEVGSFLKNEIISRGKSNLFMPMCYLYRNAIELGLKRLIMEDSHIEYSKALKILSKKKHSILGLWNSIVEEIIEYANAPDDDTTLVDSQKYIQTFHDFDPASDLFRYPCNKNMESYFINSIKLDVENVSSCFEELCNFLDGVDSMLSAIRDYEAEMSSYYVDY